MVLTSYIFTATDFTQNPPDIDSGDIQNSIIALGLTSGNISYINGTEVRDTTNRQIEIFFDNQLSTADYNSVVSIIGAYTFSKYMSACVIKDVKASGVNGGTFTQNIWVTRDINTIEGTVNFVTVSANQFTLIPGKYLIIAMAPAYQVGNHQIKIQDITNNISYDGSNSTAAKSTGMTSLSMSTTSVSLTATTVYEIQHMCSSTTTTVGLGQAMGFGDTEVYTMITINQL